MTPLQLFVVLVALAFLGGIRAARQSGGPWGFSSGIEYVGLGVVLGPHLLGLITRTAVDEFEALWLMALGWLLSLRGANFGVVPEGQSAARPLVSSLLLSALCALWVFGCAFLAARYFHVPHAFSLALGLALVCTESFHGAQAPGDQELTRFTLGTELVPVLLLACMIVGSPAVELPLPAPITGLVLTLVLGVVLGGVVTALIGVQFDAGEVWPLLLGSVLLVVGTALRLDLPAVSPAFLLGLTIGVLSRHRTEVRALINTTERQLLLPCLLLAGVALEWPPLSHHWILVAAACGARSAFKFACGFVGGRGGSLQARLALGRHLHRASGVTVAMGLVVFLRQPDDVGRTVMIAAVLSVAAGELLAPGRRQGQPSDPPPSSETSKSIDRGELASLHGAPTKESP